MADNRRPFNKDTILHTSRRIQEARMKAGWRAIDTAYELGISADQYSRIERGVTPCSLKYLYQLCQLFDVSADEILFGESELCLAGELGRLYESLTFPEKRMAIRLLKAAFQPEEVRVK